MTKYIALIFIFSIIQMGCGGMSGHPESSQAKYVKSEVKKPPLYLNESTPTGEEVTVTLSALVSETGDAKKVSIHKSSGYPHFDEAAIKAVQNWHFEPATKNGKNVEAWVLIPVKYQYKP